jgi:PAS domain S-box-containing protein
MTNERANKEIDIQMKELEMLLEKQKEDNAKLIEEISKLRQIQTYYDALMQNSEDYILICDGNGVSRAFNANYKNRGEELLNIEVTPGLTPHKMSGNPELIKYWDSLRERVLSGEKFIAEYHDEKRGLYYETLFSPIKEEGQVTGFTEITRDITRRKNVEKALQESNSFNSSLLEHSPTAIVVYDPDTSVRYVNPFFEKLTGFSSKEVLGAKIPYPWSVED